MEGRGKAGGREGGMESRREGGGYGLASGGSSVDSRRHDEVGTYSRIELACNRYVRVDIQLFVMTS